MNNDQSVPTLFEWAGGMPMFVELFRNFYDRRRWLHLLLETADQLKLPDDPEFRSAFLAYLEWGTRIAVINSNVESIDADPDMPMPEWNWGVPGGPFQG